MDFEQEFSISLWEKRVDAFLNEFLSDKTINRQELKNSMLVHILQVQDPLLAMTTVFFPTMKMLRLKKKTNDLKQFIEDTLPLYIRRSQDLLEACSLLDSCNEDINLFIKEKALPLIESKKEQEIFSHSKFF